MLASNFSSQVLLKIPNKKHFYSKLFFEGKLFPRIPLTSVKSANVLKVDPWIKKFEKDNLLMLFSFNFFLDTLENLTKPLCQQSV